MQKPTSSLMCLLLLGLMALAFTVELASAQTCPKNCSGRGNCHNGVCACNVGYGDLDCSVAAKTLNPPTKISDEGVNVREWKYYFTTGGPLMGEIKWAVTTHGSGDVDIFVQKDRFPTRSDYVARNITTAANSEILYTPSETGTYYVGVYAFFGSPVVRYDIAVSVERTCNCNGHGRCIGEDQVCECFTGWAGENCEDEVTELQATTKVTSSVAIGKWRYFRLDSTIQNAFVVIVNQTESGTDVDLFVKFNSYPTQWTYDYADRSLNKDVAMEVQVNSRRGWWYIGVYGFTAANFHIYYEVFSDCPSDCSKHGTCNTHGGCTCFFGYSGSFCETKTNMLTNGERVSGMVADNSWNYYHIQPTSVTALVVSMSQKKTSHEDCDLYVRRGSNPTLLSFDARNVSLAANTSVRIEDAQFDTWYIGVFGFTLCEYSLVVGVSDHCPPCGTHGTCNKAMGICDCDAGWTGTYCEVGVIPITNYTAVHSSSSARGTWKYYSVNATEGTLLTVHLLEKETEGYFWLFVNDKQAPTLTDYNSKWSDRESNTDHHSVTFTVPTTDTYFIGVYGSPFGMGTDSQKFPWEIQVWDSPFRK